MADKVAMGFNANSAETPNSSRNTPLENDAISAKSPLRVKAPPNKSKSPLPVKAT